MTKQDAILLLRTTKRLRSANTSFTVQTLRNEAGLKHASTRTNTSTSILNQEKSVF